MSKCPAFGCILLVVSATVHASGFALLEYGASGLGDAYAGQGVGLDGATTAWANPAAMGAIKHNSLSLNESFVLPRANFSNSGSTQLGAPMIGGNGDQGASNTSLPSFFLVKPVSHGTRLGLSVSAPFGLESNYGTSWVGRYYAEKTELKTVNIGPSLALAINPETYLGVGLDIQMGNANFSRAVDFGTVCYGQLGPATCNGFGLAPQHADGQVAISGRDTSLGYNLGIWHEFSSGARIGIHYRSRIRYHLTGTADFTVPANAQILTAGGSFVSTGASADLVTPDSLSLSFSQPVKNKRIILLGDVDYTRWDSIQAINIRYNNPQQPVTVIPMNWRNTYRVSLGMIYQESDSWLLRGGVAWDETPVQDQQGQPGIPDNNRIWLSMGARYKPSRQNSIDFGLTHIVIHAMPVDLNQSPNGNLLGNMNLKGNVVAFQYNHTW